MLNFCNKTSSVLLCLAFFSDVIEFGDRVRISKTIIDVKQIASQFPQNCCNIILGDNLNFYCYLTFPCNESVLAQHIRSVQEILLRSVLACL